MPKTRKRRERFSAMATQRKPGGYAWLETMTRGKNAAKLARKILGRLMDENPGPATEAALIGRLGLAIADVEECLRELEGYGRQVGG